MKKLAFHLSMMFVGGAIGAFSLLTCGVFANMQTGNLIKLFIAFADGFNIETITQCVLPIVGFILGVVYIKFLEKQKYINQIALISETVMVVAVAFIPNSFWLNITKSILLSFCAGCQLQAFHLFEGKFFATTMCTNNMRSIVDLAFDGVRQKDKKKLTKAGKIFIFVLAFCLGATLSAVLVNFICNYAVLLNLPFLVVAYLTIEK